MNKDLYYATSLTEGKENSQNIFLLFILRIVVGLCVSFSSDAGAGVFSPLVDWWNEQVPKALDIGEERPSINRQHLGFRSTEPILLENGVAQVTHIQYGQVHLKSPKDPLFLMIAGRQALVRVVVKSYVKGLRAPSLRLVMDHEQRGRLVDMIFPAQGALPIEGEADSPDFLKTPVERAYMAIIPAANLLSGRYRVWVSGGDPRRSYIQPYQEFVNVNPSYVMPITVMPFQWRDSLAPDMTQHSSKLYHQVFARYFPFIQPQVRVRPFSVMSAMSEADFNEQQFHLDGTTMMIMDRARKGLYVGVYNKKHRNLAAGEKVGTSSGSLLIVQDELGEAQLDVLAHEIGHSLGLKHVDCGNPEPPLQDKFPYENGGVGATWGLDWDSDQTKIYLVDPRGTKDLMSYCFNKRFISDYNYLYAHHSWINYRAKNHLALLGDIYALQLFAYPPAHQLEVHGVGDLVDSMGSQEKKSEYTFEVMDSDSGKFERIPAAIKYLGSGQQAFVARTSAVGWLNVQHIRLLDPNGEIVMDGAPTLNYLNRDVQAAPVSWLRQAGEWLTVSFNPEKYDRGVVIYEAKNGVVATLSFLDKRGRQNVSLRGLPAGGNFWVVLASTQRDPYGRRVLATVKQPWSNVMASR